MQAGKAAIKTGSYVNLPAYVPSSHLRSAAGESVWMAVMLPRARAALQSAGSDKMKTTTGMLCSACRREVAHAQTAFAHHGTQGADASSDSNDAFRPRQSWNERMLRHGLMQITHPNKGGHALSLQPQKLPLRMQAEM